MTGTTYKPACLKEPDGIHLDFLANHMFCSPAVKVLVPLSGLQMCETHRHLLSLPQCVQQSLRFRAALSHEHLILASSYPVCPGIIHPSGNKGQELIGWGAGHFIQYGFFKTLLSAAIREKWHPCDRQQLPSSCAVQGSAKECRPTALWGPHALLSTEVFGHLSLADA